MLDLRRFSVLTPIYYAASLSPTEHLSPKAPTELLHLTTPIYPFVHALSNLCVALPQTKNGQLSQH